MEMIFFEPGFIQNLLSQNWDEPDIAFCKFLCGVTPLLLGTSCVSLLSENKNVYTHLPRRTGH